MELEQEAERWGEQAEMRKQILEDMQSDRTTISRALSQNRELKEQLAELQDSFVRLVRGPARPLPCKVFSCRARHVTPLGLCFPAFKTGWYGPYATWSL